MVKCPYCQNTYVKRGHFHSQRCWAKPENATVLRDYFDECLESRDLTKASLVDFLAGHQILAPEAMFNSTGTSSWGELVFAILLNYHHLGYCDLEKYDFLLHRMTFGLFFQSWQTHEKILKEWRTLAGEDVPDIIEDNYETFAAHILQRACRDIFTFNDIDEEEILHAQTGYILLRDSAPWLLEKLMETHEDIIEAIIDSLNGLDEEQLLLSYCDDKE